MTPKKVTMEDVIHPVELQYQRSIPTMVLDWTEELVTRLQKDYDRQYKNSPQPCRFEIQTGRKYHKIIMKTACNADRTNDQTSVHAFVDKKTGEVYKAASWKGPAKHVRYDLRRIRDRQMLEVKCDWAGGYLYKV